MFGLSLSQAAATLAATFVGFDVGLFGEQVVNAVLVVILVTLLLAAVATARALPGVEPTPLEAVGLGRKVVLVAGREDRLTPLARLARDLAEREGGVVLPVRLGRHAGDVESGRSLLGLAEEALSRAGLDAESRLRIDENAVGAVASTALEEAGTVIVLDWQASARSQPALLGQRDDDLLGAASAPVVLAALSDMPFLRVVVALDRVDLAPDCAPDVTLAVEVAARLATGDVGRLLLAPRDAAAVAAVADLTAELSPAERDTSQDDRAAWVAHEARPGDLVVLPAHPDWSAFGPTAVAASARAGVSVVVVADPRRWATTATRLGALVAAGPAAPPRRWP
jgi:hypothetical protein